MRRILSFIVAGMLLAGMARADDVKLRNVELVKVGRATYIMGTATNVSGKTLDSIAIDFDILKGGKVVGRETVKADDVEAGQAWRISQPVTSKEFDSMRVADVMAGENTLDAGSLATTPTTASGASPATTTP